MTTQQQLDRLTQIAGTTLDSIHALERTTAALAQTAERHDREIGALIAISEQNAANWKNLERQWQAYLQRIPPQ